VRALVATLVLALGGCAGSTPTSELIEMAKSKDSATRVRAVRALGERGAAEADTVVPVLAAALQDENSFVRRDAASALGQIGPPASSAVPALRSATRDKNQHVRLAAADALRKVAPNLAPESKQR
jgi:HEAT repeat protein